MLHAYITLYHSVFNQFNLIHRRWNPVLNEKNTCSPGESVRRLISRYFLVRTGEEANSCGPAASYETDMQPFDGVDMVPCLRASWWPSEEFFKRSRVRDWPPAAVREEMRQFGIHLVPVGAKGSSTELHEFRLSFSRPEVVAAWHLLPEQRNSLCMLKLCKVKLGPEGKPVKSYFMKTALFWLCQDTDVTQWTSITQGMHMIIDYLERAVDARYLGCFFWSEINLLRQSSPSDLAEMRHTLSLLRRNLTPLLAHGLSPFIEGRLAPCILRESSQQLSERQLRVCLTRCLVMYAVITGCVTHGLYLHFQFQTRFLIQGNFRLERCIPPLEAAGLAFAVHNSMQQSLLFYALTVAPR